MRSKLRYALALTISIGMAASSMTPSYAAESANSSSEASLEETQDVISASEETSSDSIDLTIDVTDAAAESSTVEYATSTVQDAIDAENGVVQINCVYIDDDQVSHIIAGGTGFLVGDSEGENQYLITSKQITVPEKDVRKKAIRSFGVKKAEVNDKLGNVGYEVVVAKDMTIPATLYQESDELDLAVFSIGDKLANRVPLSIYTSDDGRATDLPYKTTDYIYSIGLPDAITYDANPNYYDKKDIVLQAGKIVNIHSINDNIVITHDSAVGANNCGGPLVNEDGNVIGMNVMMQDGIYSVAIDSTEICEVLDSFGIAYNKLTPGTMEQEVIPEPTPQPQENKDEEKEPSVIEVPVIPMWFIIILIAMAVVLLIACIAIVMLFIKKGKTPEEIEKANQKKQAKKEEKEKKKAAKSLEPVRPFTTANSGKLNVNQSGGTGMETSALGINASQETTILGSNASSNKPGTILNGGTLIRKKTGDNIILCKEETAIGKDSLHVDYCIRDNSAVSRIHAVIHVTNQGVSVEDKKSTNGTFVNGTRLEAGETKAIVKGDVIRLANEEFEYRK